MCARKARAKWLWSAKPAPAAIPESVASGSASCARAQSSRRERAYCSTVSPYSPEAAREMGWVDADRPGSSLRVAVPGGAPVRQLALVP